MVKIILGLVITLYIAIIFSLLKVSSRCARAEENLHKEKIK